MSFLFESVEGGAVRGRYSVIGLDPDLIWRTNGARAEINRNAEASRRPSPLARNRRSMRCVRSLPKAALHCPMACRRWRPACSAISATTWCG
jgi:anthranilate/para-aminobenzoate synthase component I